MNYWKNTKDERPTEGVVVDTISPGGMAQTLLFSKNLWWDEKMTMYVYYTPEKWKYI